MTTEKKIAGDRAERAAEDFLGALGFVILERNLRVGRDEIDLLVQKGDLVAIVEVRMRGATAFEGPLASVDKKKQAKLVRAAERLWRERYAKAPNPPRLRFDVVGVRVDEQRHARRAHPRRVHRSVNWANPQVSSALFISLCTVAIFSSDSSLAPAAFAAAMPASSISTSRC